MSILQKIESGLSWLEKKIGGGIAKIGKFIILAKDAETAAENALPEAIAVLKDAGVLVAATAKDGGVFFKSLVTVVDAAKAAAAKEGVSISEDEAVIAAVKGFIETCNQQNVEDVITAWHQLATDATQLDATVIAALEKMKADA